MLNRREIPTHIIKINITSEHGLDRPIYGVVDCITPPQLIFGDTMLHL